MKKLQMRLVELQEKEAEASRKIVEARDALVNGSGDVAAVTLAQGTATALAEAVAQLQRQITAEQAKSEAAAREARRDDLIAHAKKLAAMELENEVEIKAAVARLYDAMETEIANIGKRMIASADFQKMFREIESDLGETPAECAVLTEKMRGATLMMLLNRDGDAMAELYSGAARFALESFAARRHRDTYDFALPADGRDSEKPLADTSHDPKLIDGAIYV